MFSLLHFKQDLTPTHTHTCTVGPRDAGARLIKSGSTSFRYDSPTEGPCHACSIQFMLHLYSQSVDFLLFFINNNLQFAQKHTDDHFPFLQLSAFPFPFHPFPPAQNSCTAEFNFDYYRRL